MSYVRSAIKISDKMVLKFYRNQGTFTRRQERNRTLQTDTVYLVSVTDQIRYVRASGIPVRATVSAVNRDGIKLRSRG